MNVKPCRECNAIQAVAFIFDFARNFSLGEISSIQKFNDPEDLPRTQEHKSVSVQFNPGQPIQQEMGKVTGVTFDVTNDKGQPIWAVTFQENKAIIRCHEYTRWVEIFDKVCHYVDQFLDVLVTDNKVVGIGLEYFDEFNIINFNDPWMEELFKRNSTHLPSYLFDLDDVWHLHSGYLTEKKTRINRFNIDCISLGDGNYSVRMHTQHHTKLTDSVGDPFSDFKDKYMVDVIENMHSCNKYILTDVLSEEILSMINLERVN